MFVGSCSSYLPGLCLLVAASGGSISNSDESGEEAKVVLSRRCSCWDRYWAGVCLAARAQWSSSLCRRGKFAWVQKTGSMTLLVKQIRQEHDERYNSAKTHGTRVSFSEDIGLRVIGDSRGK